MPSNLLSRICKKINKRKWLSIEIGSQILNYCFEDESLTGGISSTMLKDLGVEYVLIGHSEQRNFLKEKNNLISKKIEKALDDELSVIYCIGEDIDTKNKNETYLFLSEQLDVLGQLQSINEDKLRSITVAYEPIWAIGSGLNAEKDYIEANAWIYKKIYK